MKITNSSTFGHSCIGDCKVCEKRHPKTEFAMSMTPSKDDGWTVHENGDQSKVDEDGNISIIGAGVVTFADKVLSAMKEHGIEPGQGTIVGPVESVTYSTGFPGDPERQIGEK